MADFNWHTEEDTDWGVVLPDSLDVLKPVRRTWLVPVLIIAGILLLGGLLFWQARSRVGGAENARTDDITAANNLLVYAADRSDPAILLNILPLENGPWTSFQRALVINNLVLDRWPLGLHQTNEQPVIKDITFSPDLQSADLILEIAYESRNKGRTETIHLQQTHQYQFRNEWHLVEPDSVYWGGIGNQIYESRGFTTLYPLRDEALVKRLLDDLPALLGEICGQPELPACGFALNLLIYFEKEPAMWLDLVERIEENGSYIPTLSPSSISSGVIFLPTPSLVGLPVDEAGYQALLRGYASHIFSAVMAELYGTDCCPGDLPFPLFLEVEMANRGLGFWPPPALSRQIAANPAPANPPEHDIALLCPSPQSNQLGLFRFDLAANQVAPELAGRNIVRIRAAPNGIGILVQEAEVISQNQILTRLIYWHNRTARILYEETLPETVFAAFRWQVHEEEQRLLIVVPDLDSRVNTIILVQLAECAAGICPKVVNEMIGTPTWSPDGSQFLIKSGNILWWRQMESGKISQDPIGLGTAPFWVDTQTFGFVRTREGRLQEVVLAKPFDDEMTIALTSERLRLLLSTESRPEQLMIGYVGLNLDRQTAAAQNWTILGFEWLPTGDLGEAYVFSFYPEADSLTLLLQTDQLNSFDLSPDGRFLAASLYSTTLNAWRLIIKPIQAGENSTVLPWQAKEQDDPPIYDWTADSQWLLILHQGILTFYSPEQQASQIVPPPIPGCIQAEWMD